mmetsp:Transcript_12631/g.18322  ORF Transcript_12631/g.18322 Transcript_12631/m.18322 type:complete len:278 (+) Transcript_12631:112-945(+)
MATKAPDTQDRRTKHVVHSSVNQPAKKGGAGGNYTWGTALSVTDYEPVGVGMTKVGVDTTYTVPAGVVWHDRQAPPTLNSAEAFPSLGSGASPTAVTWTRVPDKVFQAPPQTSVTTTTMSAPAVGSTTTPVMTVAAPAATASVTKVHKPLVAPRAAPEPWMVVTHNKHGKVVTTPEAVPDPEPFKGPLSSDLLREGVSAFDGQHPRNQFARKPNHVPFVAAAAEPAAPAAIDWSSFGTVSLQSQVLQASANPAHLSPYVQAKPAPTMQELKTMQPSL